MNLQDLKSLTKSIKGSPLSLRDVSGSMATCLYDMYSSSSDKFSVISNLLATWTVSGSKYTVDEAKELFTVLQQSDNGLSITTDEFKSLTISQVVETASGNVIKKLFINNDTDPCLILNATTDTITFQDVQAPTTWSDGTNINMSVTELVQHLTDGVHLTKLFADCAQIVSTSDNEEEPQAVSNIVIQTIFASNVSSAIKTWLVQSASQGPKTFIQALQSVLTKTNSNAESEAQGSGLVDTSFMVSNFSWGIVAKAVVGLAQIGAAVLLALGPIAKVIGAVASAALTLIGNIIGTVTAAAGDAVFMCKSWDGTQAFDVVFNQFELSNHTLAEAVRQTGSTAFTAVSDFYPATIIGYLKYPDADDDTLVIQELPSINFSLIAYAEDNTLSDYDELEFIPGMKITRKPSGVAGHNYDLSLAISKTLLDGIDTDPSFIGYHSCPVSLDAAYIFSKLREALTTDMVAEANNMWSERMLSSLILWLTLKLAPIMRGTLTIYNNAGHSATDWWLPQGWWESIIPVNHKWAIVNGQVVDEGDYPDAQWSVEKKLLRMWAAFTEQYIVATFNTGTMRLQDPGFSSDNLITLFSQCFSNLEWKNRRNDYDTLPFGFGSSTAFIAADLLAYEVQLESWCPFAKNDLCIWNGNILEYYIPLQTLQPGIARRVAVHVPRNTMASLMLSVLVDIAIMAAVAVVAIVAVRVGMKVKNAMSRKATDIEAKKYKYENTLTGTKTDPQTGQDVPYTKAEQDEAWNDYKKSKTNYNILANFTGSPKAEMTPYGDFGSTEDTTNTVMRGLQGDTSSSSYITTLPQLWNKVQENETTLDDLVLLIRGPVD